MAQLRAPATALAVRTVRGDLAAQGDLDVTFALFDAESLALYEKERAG